MKGPSGEETRKMDGVADVVNKFLRSLISRCTSGSAQIMPYYYVGLIGYGRQVAPAFSGKYAGKELVCVSDLAEPARMTVRIKQTPEGDEKVRMPVWFDPFADGLTPMSEAMQYVTRIVRQFVEHYQNSFPPMVINVTDGESTDGDPTEYAQQLKDLRTSNGNVLLFNIHISRSQSASITFPSSEQVLSDPYSRELFRMSSPLPPRMIATSKELRIPISDGARGFAFNADLSNLTNLLEIGTRGVAARADSAGGAAPTPVNPFANQPAPAPNPFGGQQQQAPAPNPFGGQQQQAPAPNPFGGQQQQAPAPNPFGGQQQQAPAPNPFGGQQQQAPAPNPFGGQQQQAPAPNPFGGQQQQAPAPNPFGGQQQHAPAPNAYPNQQTPAPNPYANQQNPAPNPHVQPAPNPYQQAAPQPFAAAQQEPTPNPFAADQQEPTPNPFAADQQEPTPNPFAADQQEPTPNPFAADQQEPTPNPFASTGHQKATGTVRSAQSGTGNQAMTGNQSMTGNQNQRLTGSQRALAGVGPGDVLADKYLIEAALGKGGMAVVWRGRHLLMDRPVAIKMMLPEVMEEADSMQRFLREMKAASSLKHPNIVTIYDFDQVPVPYIVMDLLNGRSLDVILEEEGKLQPARIVHILTQMCDALAVAHHANMIHRDIKPSNVVIENRVMQPDFVQLVDFGIAKLVDSNSPSMKLTKTGEIFGSILYMSPEQCMGKPLDARSDIYALGCVIFELLTGELPFAGSSVYQTLSNHVNGEPPCLSALCPDVPNADQFQEVFMKAVQKAPNARYQSTIELKKDLLKLL